MNMGSDAAEQIVRMSLEGVEVAARISGTGAKHLAVALAAMLKEEKKTAGKSRLTNMIKSGKELKVFSVPEADLKHFSDEAKRYGVLYCVVKSKHPKEGDMVDLIVRAEDAPKINRIVENLKIATVDKASVVASISKEHEAMEQNRKSQGNVLGARTTKSPQSEPNFPNKEVKEGSTKVKVEEKDSVRKKLQHYIEAEKKDGSIPKDMPEKPRTKMPQQSVHKQPKRRIRLKER